MANRSATRRSASPNARYGWPEDATFLVPDGVREHFAAGVGTRGANAHREWEERFAAYRPTYPELAVEIDQMQRRELPEGWEATCRYSLRIRKDMAGREASGKVLNALAQRVPWFLGAPRTSVRPTRRRSCSPAPENCSRRRRVDGTSISGSVNMRWARS